ncbi:MAG: RNA pseudouridine synthase, partial [Bacteroidota bacterium]|nr:RNA pseudouridine synthase [Bacteroidota bacterium]
MQENNELFEHYKFVADKGQSPLRVDKFLMNFIEYATRTKIQKAATEGN